MTYKGRNIEFTADGTYRPNSLIIDGEIYTMEEYAKEHGGHNWKPGPDGNHLCYRSESGRECTIPQAILTNQFRADLYEAYKATGLSQRALAEALGVPKRTFEDWINGKRTPTKLVQETVLEKIKSL